MLNWVPSDTICNDVFEMLINCLNEGRLMVHSDTQMQRVFFDELHVVFTCVTIYSPNN